MKIRIEKNDFAKMLIIDIKKYQFIIAISNREIQEKMLKATGSYDTLLEHQHNKYHHNSTSEKVI